MARSINELRSPILHFLSDVHEQEDGKLTLVACIMMLAMVVLIGLIGNAGHSVNQKIEAQNAADAAAFSSSLWMARGMNALTATNHMLGEATALCAIHEAIGGPGADLGIRETTQESTVIDNMMQGSKVTAPIGELFPPAAIYVPAPVHNIDKRIVDFVVKRATRDKEFKAFATIFESKMTLKRELNIQLIAKSLADLGFYAPYPFNLATVPVAYAAHIYSTSQIVLIGKEWIVLDVIEKVAGIPVFKKLKQTIEDQLVPTLVAHADFVASYDAKSGDFEAGILNSAIERTLVELQDRHSVELATYPSADELRLPVEPEPQPSLEGGPNVPEWGDDDPALPDLDIIDDLIGQNEDTLRKIEKRIGELEKEIGELDDYEEEIDERLEEDDIPDEEREELEAEKKTIDDSRKELEEDLQENQEAKQKILEEDAKLPQPGDEPPNSTHPSVKRLPQPMSQAQERYTQWVRATQPYTDSFRAPILATFKRLLPKSKAAKHYEKWSNRYTMVKAWQFRSGYRIKKSGGTSANWSKRKDALHMHVMKESFDGPQSRKGSEPWTRASDEGKAKAEEYFTLIGFAHREFKPLFSTAVYPSASNKGITTYAQAIFYNGNEQRTPSSGGYQTKIGWDTLNWDPDTQVPEWGTAAKVSGDKWPWEVFNSDEHEVKVKLNWQPKLMPITQSRLEASSEDLSGDMADNVDHAIEYFEQLGTH